MADLRQRLVSRRRDKQVDQWADEINKVIKDHVSEDDLVKPPTLYSYLNGHRDITGKGARALAVYFYQQKDFDMVNAISRVVLGIPYPVPDILIN